MDKRTDILLPDGSSDGYFITRSDDNTGTVYYLEQYDAKGRQIVCSYHPGDLTRQLRTERSFQHEGYTEKKYYRGALSSATKFSPEGVKLSEILYDEDCMIKERVLYSQPEEGSSLVERFDIAGKRISATRRTPLQKEDGQPNGCIYSYYDDRNILEQTKIYNADDDVVLEEEYDRRGELSMRTITTYLEPGVPGKEERYAPNGTLLGYTLYEPEQEAGMGINYVPHKFSADGTPLD